MIGTLAMYGIASRLSCDRLFSSPAMANDCPSRSSTSVSARRTDSAGMRKPDNVTPLGKSSVLTSGRTLIRMVSPAIVGVKFSRMPNSLYETVTWPRLPDTVGTGISPPARKLAS